MKIDKNSLTDRTFTFAPSPFCHSEFIPESQRFAVNILKFLKTLKYSKENDARPVRNSISKRGHSESCPELVSGSLTAEGRLAPKVNLPLCERGIEGDFNKINRGLS